MADYCLAEVRGVSFNKCSSSLFLAFSCCWGFFFFFFVNIKEGCLKLNLPSRSAIGNKRDLPSSDVS